MTRLGIRRVPPRISDKGRGLSSIGFDPGCGTWFDLLATALTCSIFGRTPAVGGLFTFARVDRHAVVVSACAVVDSSSTISFFRELRSLLLQAWIRSSSAYPVFNPSATCLRETKLRSRRNRYRTIFRSASLRLVAV